MADLLRAIPHTIGVVMPGAILVGAALGGGWTFLPAVVLYGAMPLVDALAGLNPLNPAGDDAGLLEQNGWFRAITWAWVPLQVGLIAWMLWFVGRESHPVLEYAGVTFSTGLTTGAIGLTFAHELIHRPGRWERALGDVLLASVCYPHFAIEHVYGHHRHVATPRDPASAPAGESLYRFLPRTLTGSFRSAWGIEAANLAKRGRRTWSPSNRFVRYAVTQAGIVIAIAWGIGGPGVVAFFAQSLVAVTLLETVNYIEHYGLQRREIAPGRYEPVRPQHSWNSCHRVSNWVLINLARHTDHHLAAAKRYQLLNHLEEAPQLPAGYGTMMLVAMIPPLWRRVMDPRAARWRS